MRAAARALAAALLALGTAPPARGGLPCVTDPTGVPSRWTMPVPYHLDPAIGIGAGAPLAAAAARAWEEVATARVQFAAGPALPVAVDASNWDEWVGRCGDGLSPLVFDASGAIIDAMAGEGASDVILGLTVHDCGETTAPVLSETSIVINVAAFGFATAASRAALVGVITHEFGHQLNLCHSLLNAPFVDDGDAGNDAFVPVMFPQRSSDVVLTDPTPRFDDTTMLSLLYPAPGFFPSTATISGHVLSGEHGSPATGASLVVRSLADPLATAQWTTAGWLRVEGSADVRLPVGEPVPAIDGSYQASGLPAGSYTVQVEPGLVDAVGEFYSGAAESGDPVADPPDLVAPVEVAAGETRSDVTIALPQRVRSPLGETAWEVRWRVRLAAQGETRRLGIEVPPGRLELFSTGTYNVTPLAPLGGQWRARGRRGLRHVVDPAQMGALFDLSGASSRITRVGGHGSADRRLAHIRGAVVLHARLLEPPRIPFRVVVAYRGGRAAGARTPGRVPIVPTS